MATHPTIYVQKNGINYKFTKVWFGNDGSYYVTVPYHPEKKAILMKMPVVYNEYREKQFRSFNSAVEVAVMDDDDLRIKMSHHPDGFCQFSGKGIISGLDENKQPKGIGLYTSPLDEIGRGPAFSVVVQGIEVFDQGSPTNNDIVFSFEEMNALLSDNGFILEGHYFHRHERRFIRKLPDGQYYIYLRHPSDVILPLRVLFPPDQCKTGAFLGLELYAHQTEFPVPSFGINGPGEPRESDPSGYRQANVLMSVFPPPPGMTNIRSIIFNENT